MSRLLCLAAVLWSAGGAGPARAAVLDVETFPAAAGQPRIVLARRPGTVATIRIAFATGAADDGESRGITRLAQHALLAANRRLHHEALLLDVHAAAADLHVETGLQEASFTLTADHRDFARIAKQLAAGVLEPRLDPDRFPRAMDLALMDARLPGRGAGLASLVASLFVMDSRFVNEPFGDRGALDGVGVDEVVERLKTSFSPANATVIVTGRFDRDDLLRFLRGFRGGRAASAQPPPRAPPAQVRRRASRETYVLAYPLPPATARGAATTRVAVAALEGELWRRFRGAGLGYSFAVQPLRTGWFDALLVVLPAHDATGVDFSAHLLDTIEGVRSGRLGDAAFERARRTALARLEAEDRDPPALAAALSRDPGRWHGREVAEQLRALGRAEFLDAVAQTLARERSSFAYLGPTP